MSRGFAYYRDARKSALQNVEYAKTELPMPVLALGASSGVGDRLRVSMKAIATQVEGEEIEDCGHYVMEEQPDVVSKQLLEFFQRIEAAQS